MHTIAIAIAIFAGLLVSIFFCFLSLVLSGKSGAAAQGILRERLLAEYKINARLLRLNL
jgi:hypothetical protein